ncbi:DNA replication/repair protein RecF [Fructilactobacillus lindneri]|uniref:DNA replication and repair protein RecF n=2 Tax=Fructilactobacillus lindneri TaxID=53444 RepID=A0A0R2JM36_9LACO|nr:DNA replication/repair protein RecF [Fructilactobacillus lindneri]ANZ57545.1 DNA replication/repair protein RecF [Fructilactobacillus lindneri]ANZ58813.1 DNA replication/repair protein RecF [Fructilactobacillus lindneri]KRN78271.1 DNA replication and repair protein recF [Fructilactobacillus lindneri DSM 20690 = JCM 11027]POG97694.1 DNA replication/repair protein RecF [Fructilactobacillus lindneri]POH00081.1 DNA replication/repair protein RecF [Fructilactobacillus lindneri]
MQVNELKLRNFRNYQNADVHFSKGINVLMGQNAQGKTNLLEAIYVLALTKSHRATNNRDLIEWNDKKAAIWGEIQHKTGKTQLELTLSSKGKRARVNHIEQAKLSTYIGQLNVILFAPEDLKIVKGSPQVRRHFMDIEFGQMSSKYLYNTSQYRRILKQRNIYLRQLHLHKAKDLMYLDVLSDQLSAYAAEIIYQRVQLLGKLQKWSQSIHSEISQQQEVLKFNYVTSLRKKDLGSVEQIYQTLLAKFKANHEKEIRQGTTIFGPHRDDLRFMVNGKDVATFGSQGQQRTAALSTKLAEIDLMKEETNEYPVLLLDDVLSELDEGRQTHLLTAIQNKVQTFLTTTSMNGIATNLINNPKMFHIENGVIS